MNDTIKILNLECGIGGNRKLYGDNYEITAVDNDENVLEIYRDNFSSDTVILADASEFLLNNYTKYHIILSSPPCPTHSQYRYNVGVRAKGFKPVYPDMTLYQRIIFLKYHFKGIWVVENVKPYYEPLIKPQIVSKHYIWSNIHIPNINVESTKIHTRNKISELEDFLGYDLSGYKIPNKRQILRNCINPLVGKHIIDTVIANLTEIK